MGGGAHAHAHNAWVWEKGDAQGLSTADPLRIMRTRPRTTPASPSLTNEENVLLGHTVGLAVVLQDELHQLVQEVALR